MASATLAPYRGGPTVRGPAGPAAVSTNWRAARRCGSPVSRWLTILRGRTSAGARLSHATFSSS